MMDTKCLILVEGFVILCLCVVQIQGAVMCAALFEIVIGATGAVGAMLRFIGPLCICPTVSLLGFSLFQSAAVFAAKQWWIAVL